MLKSMPLRWRLSLLLGTVMTTALAFGSLLLARQAGARISAETQAATVTARYFIEDALANARAASDPQAELAHILDQARNFRHLRVYWEENESPSTLPSRNSAPAWFSRLLHPSKETFRLPLSEPLHGAVLIVSDPEDEISEIWLEVSGLVPGGALLTATTLVLVFLVVSHSLAPVLELTESLRRLERGERSVRVQHGASREFVVIAKQINALAESLDVLDEENHRLLQRMIQVQEDERKDIARDLHDEIGPFLFTIRAGLGALARRSAGSAIEPECGRIDAQVAALQQVNRRILARLRPAALEEMGLAEALQTLAEAWRDSHPKVSVEVQIVQCKLNEASALAAYRVVQEGLTNAFRHSGAQCIEVWMSRDGPAHVLVSVRDNGSGLRPGQQEGLGLRGLRERVSALGGNLTLSERAHGGAELVARLPN